MSWHRPKSLNLKSEVIVGWPDRGLGFATPALAPNLDIDFDRLTLSIARNLALRSARAGVVSALRHNVERLLRVFVDNRYRTLRLLPDVDDLADQTLVSLAHDLGGGVAGLWMEDAGFVWRDHAKRQLPKSRRRPDYVWSTGHYSGGVALSEVKGSASGGVPFGKMIRRAAKGFKEQVNDWQLDATSYGDPILAGYALGVHLPGGRKGGVAAHRSSHPPGVPAPTRVRTATRSVARGHYAANFTLMGATGPALQLVGRRLPSLAIPPVRFERVEVDGRELVVRVGEHSVQRSFAMTVEAFEFAISLTAEEEVYPRETGEKLDRAQLLAPPVVEGPDVGGSRGRQVLRALSSDGLALLRPRRLPPGEIIAEWQPRSGFAT